MEVKKKMILKLIFPSFFQIIEKTNTKQNPPINKIDI